MRTSFITYLLLFFFCGLFTCGFSQGHIDHIKNQPYLKYAKGLDCENHIGDNLSERICANLAFQKSDSLLTLIYDSLLKMAPEHYIDSLKEKIIILQENWRELRSKQCAIIYDAYEDCGGCHQRSIDYLYCLKEVTDRRTQELRRLYIRLH